MIGIYKITSPSNRVYIGQSRNIESRFSDYKRLLNCKTQTLLLRSFKKYGVENHSFGVIEECLFEQLNERERYWQEFYSSANGGLNCKLTNTKDKPAVYSEESRLKMSANRTGEKNHMFGKTGERHHMFGTKQSEETKAKYANRKGVKKSEEHRRKIGEANARRVIKDSTRSKMSDNAKKKIGILNPFFGRKHSEEAKQKMRESKLKIAP